MKTTVQLETSLITALKASPIATLATLQRALVAASNHWATTHRSAADTIDALVDAANEPLEALAVAIEGGDASPRRWKKLSADEMATLDLAARAEAVEAVFASLRANAK